MVDNLIKEFVLESAEGLDRMEAQLMQMREGACEESLAEALRSVHTIKGTAGFFGLHRMERLGHAGESLLVAMRDAKVTVSEGCVDLLMQLMDRLRTVLQLVERTGKDGQRPEDDDTELVRKIEESVEQGGEATMLVPVVSEVARVKPAEGVESTLRVPAELLNRLMNQVGKLAQARNEVQHAPVSAESYARLGEQMERLSMQMRETVMQARLQPASQLFQRLPRLAHDVARVCGKKVRMEFEGGDSLLDKSVIERLRDPLTHIVRNAIDHGVEEPRARLLRGKAAEGTLRVTAYHEGGQVVIAVSDDGGGVDRERVLQRAVKNGLISAAQALKMRHEDVGQLMCEEGFSTRDEVTMISGRGVGMDVVRTNVEGVGGSVEVLSVPGEGTTVRLRVPLTLAIVPALIADCGGQPFALLQRSLREVVMVTTAEAAEIIRCVGGAKMFLLRERIIPLLDLREKLGFGCERPQRFFIVVVEVKGKLCGLMVDDVLAPQEIVMMPVPKALGAPGFYSGATMLGDGRIALVLDIKGLVGGVNAGVGVARFLEDDVTKESGRSKAGSVSMLLCTGHNGERITLPLTSLERIEEVSAERVEYLEGQPLIQYCGEPLALDDPGGLLRREAGVALALLWKPENSRSIRRGLVVRDVLGIEEGESLEGLRGDPRKLVKVGGKLGMLPAQMLAVGGNKPGTGVGVLLEAA